MTDQDDKVQNDAPVVEEKVEEQPQASTGGAMATGTDQHGRQLYKVNCSTCGNETEVPFKPSGDRPVYCRDCYMKQRDDRRGGGRSF